MLFRISGIYLGSFSYLLDCVHCILKIVFTSYVWKKGLWTSVVYIRMIKGHAYVLYSIGTFYKHFGLTIVIKCITFHFTTVWQRETASCKTILYDKILLLFSWIAEISDTHVFFLLWHNFPTGNHTLVLNLQ